MASQPKTSTRTDQTHLSLRAGLDAFKACLQPQEGAFMRGASVVMNPVKDQTFKPSRGGTSIRSKEVLGRDDTPSDNERTARALLERNASGQFTEVHKLDCQCPKCREG